jgi:hypothetical protein
MQPEPAVWLARGTTFSRARAGGFNIQVSWVMSLDRWTRATLGLLAMLAMVLSKTGYNVVSATRDFSRGRLAR